VYGHVRQGSISKRVTSLLLAVPNVQSTSAPLTESPSPTSNTLEQERPQLASVPPPSMPPPASSATQPQENQSSSEPYPAVTALEEQILGKSEANLPLPQRLSNMEIKAFGKASSLDDLGKRVDLLKQYVAKKNGGNENYLTSSNAVGWAPADQSLEGQVASMEKEVYGVTYANDRLTSRLDRLDRTLLPHEPPQTFTPLVTRIDNLEAALNPTGSQQQMISMRPKSEYQNKVKVKHSIFHKLGVVAADVGKAVATSALSSGYGYGYGGYGGPMMGGPGFGYW